MNDLMKGSASVILGSVSVFPADISMADREDLQLVNLFAQQATREEYRTGINTDWLDNYRRKLSFMGWDATPPPGIPRRGPDRARLADEAVALIEQAGSPGHARITQQAMEALQADEDAAQLFESEARTEDRAHFQLLPCLARSGDYVDMVLVHMELQLRQAQQRFLFFSRNPSAEVRTVHAELVRFNLRIFRDHMREQVMARVTAKSRRSIRELPLQG